MQRSSFSKHQYHILYKDYLCLVLALWRAQLHVNLVHGFVFFWSIKEAVLCACIWPGTLSRCVLLSRHFQLFTELMMSCVMICTLRQLPYCIYWFFSPKYLLMCFIYVFVVFPYVMCACGVRYKLVLCRSCLLRLFPPLVFSDSVFPLLLIFFLFGYLRDWSLFIIFTLCAGRCLLW